VEGSRESITPKLRWLDGVKAGVEWKGLNIEDAKMCVYVRGIWKRVVQSNTFHIGIADWNIGTYTHYRCTSNFCQYLTA
jgi:hypothetical protein